MRSNMENKELRNLKDEELIVERKKLKKSKIIQSAAIGFLAGILLFGIVSWSLSSDKNIGFLIPMFIPVYFIYLLTKNSKKNKKLEDSLKKRQSE